MFKLFTDWLKARLHVKPGQLKNVPGVHDAAAAAEHINGVIGAAIDAAAPQGVQAVERALHVHPETLKGAPGVGDHAAAAGVINEIVKAKVEGQ